MNHRVRRAIVFGLLAVSVLGAAVLAQVREKPLPGLQVFVGQTDDWANRVVVTTDAQGRFAASGMRAGMHRVVVQVPEPAPAKAAGLASAPAGKPELRTTRARDRDLKSYGPVRAVKLQLDGSINSGPSEMAESLVNGRTQGVFVQVSDKTEVIRGRVVLAPYEAPVRFR